jgi:hypothetical protein
MASFGFIVGLVSSNAPALPTIRLIPENASSIAPLPALAAVLAPGTAAVPVGLYAMAFASYSNGSQFKPLNATDYAALVRGPPPVNRSSSRTQGPGYVAALSLHFSWADIQPHAPPAPYDFSALSDVLDGLDAACADAGRAPACVPVFLKPYLAREPAWTTAALPDVTTATVATNALGMRVVQRPTYAVNGTDMWNKNIRLDGGDPQRAIPISTDETWQRVVSELTVAIGGWLAEVDPAVTRVRVLHFMPSMMASLQMRPGPMPLWMAANLTNDGTDGLGMGWSKAGHLAAWTAQAVAMRGLATSGTPASAALAARTWAFDFTNLPPRDNNASALSFDTAEQLSVFDALVAAHPAGPGAVLAKTESLHVDLGPGDSFCSFKPDPLHSQRAFAYQYLRNSAGVPYHSIGARGGRHGWENYAPLAMPSLPRHHTQIPGMYPVQPDLARNSMFADLNATGGACAQPTGSLWAEIWRDEAIAPDAVPSCEARRGGLRADLALWDSQLRSNYVKWHNHNHARVST